MKMLITLSVLQTIGIVTLVVHAFGARRPSTPDILPATTFSSRAAPAAPGLDERRLRAIVREELAPLKAPIDVPPAAAPPASPPVDLRQREVVAQQIEAYRAMGTITDLQMQELQAEIAQLDDASRKQLMSKLLRALNSGDIKGRL